VDDERIACLPAGIILWGTTLLATLVGYADGLTNASPSGQRRCKPLTYELTDATGTHTTGKIRVSFVLGSELSTAPTHELAF